MVAGVGIPYERQGLETADLINNQWPLRHGEYPVIREYGRTAADIGTGVHCHASNSYSAPSYPAGTSKRMGAFYEKTGVLQHRTEPGFRDKRGMATLTEVPLEGYGTLRQSNLPKTGSMVLGRESQRFFTRGHPEAPVIKAPDYDTASMRSRGSRASGASRTSRASGRSQQAESSYSAVSSQPSWARRTNLRSEMAPWNFDTLPMYEKSSESYGKQNRTAPMRSHPAGRSESGFMGPEELIRTLTRRD